MPGLLRWHTMAGSLDAQTNAKLWLGQTYNSKLEYIYMYKMELSEERIKVYAMGLDSAVKVAASSLSQGNSLLALKQLLPNLIQISQEADVLNNALDELAKSKLEDKKTE